MPGGLMILPTRTSAEPGLTASRRRTRRRIAEATPLRAPVAAARTSGCSAHQWLLRASAREGRVNQRRPLRVVPAGRPRGSSAHPGAAAPPTAGLPAATAARDPRGRAAAAQRFSHANRRPPTGRWRAAGSGCAPRGVAAMMPALAAHRRGCRGLYRLYLRCQAAPLPRSCHGESLKARRAAWPRGAAGTPPVESRRKV